ncbi:MAG: alpha/beta hydrolase, partial [Phaeodactylibacter sp.]|nr:alpha/beta hydrolase [Phaeodactylibacter sp.]
MEKLPLLLLHGALGSKAQFSALKAKLNIDFEVFDFDFQGHGGRTVESPFTMDLFTDNVLSFLDDNDLGKVHIFGYSMGGYVTLNTALKLPGRISKITTLGTKFDWSLESAEKEIKMLNPEKVEEKVPG